MATKLEICIALEPEQLLSENLVGLSEELARQSGCAGDVVLQLQPNDRRLSTAAHLTLYQLSVPISKVEKVDYICKKIAAEVARFDLEGALFSDNAAEGSAEIKYTPNARLIDLQTRIVTELNPLREGLVLEHNPAGRPIAELQAGDSEGPHHANLKKYGFAECGAETFNPHVTLSWLGALEGSTDVYKQLIAGDFTYGGAKVGVKPLQFSGGFTRMAVYVMGPQGTCVQRVGSHKLSQPATHLKFSKPAFLGLGMHTIEFPGPKDYPMVNQLLPGGFAEQELGLEIGMAIVGIEGKSMRGDAGKGVKKAIKGIKTGKIMHMTVKRGLPWPQEKTMVVVTHESRSAVKSSPRSAVESSPHARKYVESGYRRMNAPGRDFDADRSAVESSPHARKYVESGYRRMNAPGRDFDADLLQSAHSSI